VVAGMLNTSTPWSRWGPCAAIEARLLLLEVAQRQRGQRLKVRQPGVLALRGRHILRGALHERGERGRRDRLPIDRQALSQRRDVRAAPQCTPATKS